MDLSNSMHTTENKRPTKQMMKICIGIRNTKRKWAQSWTILSFRVPGFLGYGNATSEKPMWTRTNTDPHYFDDITWKPTSSRLYGYLLTRIRSLFLETEGSLAWIYHCSLVLWPLQTMNLCYDRISILYDGQIRFVDPITRQTHPAANVEHSTDPIKNLLQFDIDQEDSWYTLSPGIVHQDRPVVFGPKDVSSDAVHSSTGSQDARMYTRNKLSNFWDSIIISAASQNALKKIRWNSKCFLTTKKNLEASRIMRLEVTSLWITWSLLDSSKTDLWTPLDQLLMFLNIVESIVRSFVQAPYRRCGIDNTSHGNF